MEIITNVTRGTQAATPTAGVLFVGAVDAYTAYVRATDIGEPQAEACRNVLVLAVDRLVESVAATLVAGERGGAS